MREREAFSLIFVGKNPRARILVRASSLEAASISPIRDASGKITHYVAIKDDITEADMHPVVAYSQSSDFSAAMVPVTTR